MTYNIRNLLDDLKTTTYNFLTKKERMYNVSVDERRATPVYNDIAIGVYTRYFACRANLVKYGPVYEVDSGQYSGLKLNPNFVTVQIPWRIRGPLDDEHMMISQKEVVNPGVESENKALVETAAKIIPAIVYYLKDPLEYYQGDFLPEE